MSLTIREAGPQDYSTIAAFILQLWTTHQAIDDRVNLENAEIRAREMPKTYRVHLFDADEKPVAYAATQDNGDHVFIRHFVVDSDARHAGLGRAAFTLLRDAIFPGRKFRLDAAMTIPGPKAFWEAMGFSVYAYVMERAAP